MSRKPVRLPSRKELLDWEDRMRLSRQLNLDRMSVPCDDVIAVVEQATLNLDHHRKRGRQEFNIPTEVMAWLLNVAALGRNDRDAAKALRRDNAVRQRKRNEKDAQRPDEFRRKALTAVDEQLPLVEPPTE